MGKPVEDELPLPSAVVSDSSETRVETRCQYGCGFGAGIWKIVGFRCVGVLLVSAALFLSAVFWLPPFSHYADQRDLDLDLRYLDHEIVASFDLEKSVSLLEDNILQLEGDIFDEIGVPTIKVVILSLKPIAESNKTRVVFGVDAESGHTQISETAQSLIRASFVSLVTRQFSLRLTRSLFGDPLFFEVLKFPGGITVIPLQSAFLLQKVQILFNFTLNFSIYQIQINFNELASQLKSGLHLAPYENLYIKLSNPKGSTVAPPTTVQSSVLLAVGNTPSMPRLKQLAQTITDPNARNLGLNNTVFGRVKQVQLSSILQHSLHGGDSSGTSPSPAPQPHDHDHDRNHHHHHHHNANLAPAISPIPVKKGASSSHKGVQAPAPAPERSSPAPKKSYEANPPGCKFRHKRKSPRKARRHSHLSPTVAPTVAPRHSAAPPQLQVNPPAPIARSIPAYSPLPNVVFAHAHPPSKSEPVAGHSDRMPSVSPSPSPSLATSSSSAGLLPTLHPAFFLLLALTLHLQQ